MRWLRKGNNDFRRIEILRRHDPTDLEGIAFFCQQGAEKYLKAWLSYHETEFTKTHSLKKLLDLLGPHYAATERELEDAERLSPFAVEVRYPTEDEAEPDIDVLLAAATHFRHLVQRYLAHEPQLAPALS